MDISKKIAFQPEIYQDIERLSKIAKKYKMVAFMSNFIGKSGEYICAGKSSIWNTEGKLIGQLDDQTEGILIYDTETELVTYERITAVNNTV